MMVWVIGIDQPADQLRGELINSVYFLFFVDTFFLCTLHHSVSRFSCLDSLLSLSEREEEVGIFGLELSTIHHCLKGRKQVK